MSTGLSLIKVMCMQGSRSDFRRLTPDYFNDDERPVYDYVAHHYRQYGQLPTLEALADNGLDLIRVRDNETAAYYRARLAQRHIVNSARLVLPDLQRAIVQGHAEQITDMVADLHSRIRITDSDGSVVRLDEAVSRVIEAFEAARRSPGIQGLTFGYDWLDNITGGAQGGDIITLAAMTGMGKSYFLNHMAMAAWLNGASILFVSNEMTVDQITTRFIGQYTGIRPDYIQRGTLSAWTEDRFRLHCQELMHGAPFTLVEGGFGLKITDVDSLVQEFNPDIVYIDASYLLIPKETRHTEKGWERMREMSKDLKRIAQARDKPVIQTVQLSADAKNKRRDDMDANMIGGSIGIAQDSTTVMILAPGEGGNEEYTREFVVAKNREGARSWMRTHFLFNPMDFGFITSKELEEEGGRTLTNSEFEP